MRMTSRWLLAAIITGALALPGTGALASATSTDSLARMGPIHEMYPSGDRVAPAGAKNMPYHGGAIEKAPKIYLVFWGWKNDPDQVAPYLINLYKGVGGSAWNQTVTQYYETKRGHITNPAGQLAGIWHDDTTPLPLHPTYSDFTKEGQKAAAHFKDYGMDADFVLATAQGHESKGFGPGGWCAWHSYVPTSHGYVAITDLPYMPDGGQYCGAHDVNHGASGIRDGVSIAAGHEYAEAETDPFGGGWYDREGKYYMEIGDKCAFIFHGQGAMRNVTLSTGVFAMQSLWSNAFNQGNDGCVMETK